MSFLTPIALLGSLLAIPIILLYMLRLRRREIVVSSNFLWQQILRDHEANTPWQRLRRNLLLILQLLILVALVLALARPAQVVPTISAGRTVILLDASASMNATDIDGQSRFQEAQHQASLLLNEIAIDDEATVIRVADVVEPLIPYTNDINALRSAINNAEPGSGGGDWDTALTLAAAGAEGVDDFSIVIISDGGLGETARLPENIPQPAYIPIGQSSDNLAISALATRTLPGQDPQLFAQVRNFSSSDAEVGLVIRLDGELWDSVSRPVSANSQRSFIFSINQPFTTIQAELVLDEDTVTDYLALDNVAYAVAGDTRTRRVLLISDQENVFLDQVLRSIPGAQVFRGDATRPTLPTSPYDLYIFNQYLPATLPDADMLIIDPPGSTDLFTVDVLKAGAGQLRIVDETHPLATFLSVDSINLRQFRGIEAGAWAQPIIETQNGTIVWAGEDDSRQIILMGFNVLDSDLPLQIAWPLLMSNALEWFSPANIVNSGTIVTVGDLLRINPPLDADAIRVTEPDGTGHEFAAENSLSFAETHAPGLYTVDVVAGDEVTATQIVAVNLFGQGESDITPVAEDAVQVGGGIVDLEAEEQLGFREFWPIVAGLALLLLIIEWFVYFQRLRVPTQAGRDIRRTTARS